MYQYQPKKPVKSFQDLAVYQTTYNLAIKIIKHLQEGLSLTGAATAAGSLVHQTKERTVLSEASLKIPRLILTAHSIRFADPQKAIAKLEQAMLNCNLAVHYLNLARDLGADQKGATLAGAATAAGPLGHRAEGGSLPSDLDQLQKDYLQVRRKILNLQRSWQRFMQINKLKQNA